jgi:hypothetical protein
VRPHKKLTDYRIRRRDPRRRRFFGHGLLNVGQVLVANGQCRALVPGIDKTIASYRFQYHIDRQLEWAEDLLQLFERFAFLQQLALPAG